MAQLPDSTSFPQPLLGPPPLMGVQYHQQHQSDLLYQQVKVHVITAVQAVERHDARSLVLAYANIGVVLGIEKTSTDLVQCYANELKDSTETKPQISRRPITVFRKDGANLEAMISDIGVEEKIVHQQKFMRRRRIPEYVIKTLHVPKRVICDEEMLKVDDGLQKIGNNSVCEKNAKQSIACQTQDLMVRRDSICQTVEESMKRAIFDDPLHLDVACQTRDESMQLDVACQMAERPVCRDNSCQTIGVFVCEKLSQRKNNKIVIGKLVRTHRGGRKRQIAKSHLDCTSDSRNSEDAPIEKKILKDAICKTDGTSMTKKVDDEVSEVKSKKEQQKINHHQTADPGGVMRQKDEINNKRLAPYKIRRRLTSARPPSNTQCTQLVINGLDPKFSIEEIYGLFGHLKSMECCSLKYNSSGLSLGIATVAFADRLSAIEMLNHFEDQIEGSCGVNMRLGATELSID